MQYEIVLTLRARDGERAVTSALLPEVIAFTTGDVLPLLIATQTMTGNLNIGNLYELAAKIEADVNGNKYKWIVDKERSGR